MEDVEGKATGKGSPKQGGPFRLQLNIFPSEHLGDLIKARIHAKDGAEEESQVYARVMNTLNM